MHSFAPFSNLNFFVKNRQKRFAIELMNFVNSIANNWNFAFFLRIFDEFFSGFRAKFQKIVTGVVFSIKFAKTNQKFAENSEFRENYSLIVTIIQNYSLVSLGGLSATCSWCIFERIRDKVGSSTSLPKKLSNVAPGGNQFKSLASKANY